ncbi:MAG: cation:proton antiporter [Micromonosporaceae bacterium]|nr:cation:proton antiporter [Micromonosporaceae bacterium]
MHPALLLIELGAVVLGLGLLSALAVRVGISPIPLYLLAGLAFGHGGLLPLDTSEEFIGVGAEIGVVLLLFTLGLEYTPDELVANLRHTAPVGLLDLALNAAPGAMLALWLGWGPVGALVLGGVTYISSSGIVAKLLGDLGWLGNREAPVVLSLLVFEDLAMAVYLPILTTVLAGVGVYTGAVTMAGAITAVAVVLYVALRHGRLVQGFLAGPRVGADAESGQNDEVLLLKVLGLVLLVAGIAQQLQVSAAVGAFLVGIAVSGPLAESARQLLSPLRDLFAAAFFVFFGLQIDPATLWPVAGYAVLLAAAGVLTKFATGHLAARRAGIGRFGRARAGAALVPRGEFNIVIAGLAVAAGLDTELGALAGAYVLILAMAGPLIARAVEPLLRARRRAVPADVMPAR